jgi:hypothetical protein
MVRKSLIVAALLAVSSPLAAQEEWVWTSDRLYGTAPLGVMGDRILEQGEIQLNYRLVAHNSRGIWFVTDSLPLATTLQLYSAAPLKLTAMTHLGTAAFGLTPDITVMVSGKFSLRERDQLSAAGVFYTTTVKDFGDVSVDGLIDIVRSGPYRAHIRLGAVIPVGVTGAAVATPFSTSQRLPYDQRPGKGAFAATGGMTAQMQNEVGSIGGQFNVRVNVASRTDYTVGDSYEGTGWVAYKINDAFSVSWRLDYQSWGHVEGADLGVDPTQDPGMDGLFLAGQRLDMPIGVNFEFPEGSRLAGHRIALEAIYPLHHDYEGPQLGLDWGIFVGAQLTF